MRLFPREIDRLLLHQAAELARSRHKKGLPVSEPEARAMIADAICEGAREGGTVSDMVSLGASLLTEDDVMPGVAERIDVVMVEAFFPDGQKLVCVHAPIGPGTSDLLVPLNPRWKLGEGPVEVNSRRDTTSLRVQSKADRPIQIGSHYHFFEVNPALYFDRTAAYGFRLDIPAGTTLRFEPGDLREVDLVAIGGARIVNGLAGLVNGSLDDPNVYSAAKSRLSVFLQE
ncbi:Urease subunit alpha [Marinobacter vinifirmus]|uniref:Urease subunit beta n=1 Tax=Marinobacter vinifirmus TaxID=355591 RepID=A0A7Z1DRR0_9GAMM|nr:urease subunit beta [Marinobacter vinifirmus]MCP4062660.1 urease subunit beta [Gammaproteobacteria bacterium]MTI78997.1 urease subunit beta [Marinobacter sp.]OZC34748.1 Urease subunit alpha [Marinobacter vinifirmus]|tara:strand:+ start:9329 stop:10015 length:687 start_codon:yes stop_codon:yes gene_type:complete